MRTTTFAVVAVSLAALCACGTPTDRTALPPRSGDEPRLSASPTTAPPFVEKEPGCLELVDGLAEPPPTAVRDDFLHEVVQGQLALLPAPGHEAAVVESIVPTATPEQFLSVFPNVIAPQERRRALVDAGFAGSVSVSYLSGDDRYGMDVLSFATPEGAADYLRVHLRRVCQDAVALQPLPDGLPGVVYWRQQDERLTARAIGAVGTVEFAATICRCAEVQDQAALAGEWLRAVMQQATGATPA